MLSCTVDAMCPRPGDAPSTRIGSSTEFAPGDRRLPVIVAAPVARIAPLVALLTLVAAAAGAEPFRFVSLPDTQVYAENRFPEPGRTPAVTDPRGTGAIFLDQTSWIVEMQEALGIRYVGHLGDIVQDGNDIAEWERAKAAMDRLLDADIPHGTVMGNHDDNHPPDYARNYLDYFGPQHFEDRPWYTAHSPGGGANVQVLEHNRYKIGFLNFSIDHPASEVAWAHDFVEQNPDTIFVIGTHRYLYDFKLAGGRYDEVVPTILGDISLPQSPVSAVVNPTGAEDLFHDFVTEHPNILMIHAGHFHAEWLRLDGLNDQAKLVIQILTDYQSTRNGGDGWLRLYELDFEAGAFRFDTYSPTLERTRSTIDHYVETIYLAWDQRDQVIDVLGATEELYLFFLEIAFKRSDDIPDGFLLQHPDFDTPEERAYYEQYLDDLFHGERPPGFENILDWEQLWAVGFANDPDDLTDFSDGVRSPQGELTIDFHDYFTASASQLAGWSFDELLEAAAGLSSADFRRPFGKRLLDFWLGLAAWLSERGSYDVAELILTNWVLPQLEGCDDGNGNGWSWLWAFFGRGPGLFASCEAQALVEPLVAETATLLATLDTP